MFVQPLDEQAIRLGSEITFLRQMATQLEAQLKEAQDRIKTLEAEKKEQEAIQKAEKEVKQ